MDVRHITCEGRSLPSSTRLAWKGFLKEDDTWEMLQNVGLELRELNLIGYATNIPGDNFKLRCESCSWVSEAGGKWRLLYDLKEETGLQK